MSGRAISMIDRSIVAINTPSVVLDRAIHLYRSSWSWPVRARAFPPDDTLVSFRRSFCTSDDTVSDSDSGGLNYDLNVNAIFLPSRAELRAATPWPARR